MFDKIARKPIGAVSLGEFVEVRNGEKRVIEKFEIDHGTVAQRNAQKDALAERILASKIKEDVAEGKLEASDLVEEIVK